MAAPPPPMAHSYRLRVVSWGYQVRIPVGRIFVIVAVHIQCSKLFKGMECTVLLMVLCTIKNPLSHSKYEYGIVPASGFRLSRYCHDCAESDVKQYLYSLHMYTVNSNELQPVCQTTVKRDNPVVSF